MAATETTTTPKLRADLPLDLLGEVIRTAPAAKQGINQPEPWAASMTDGHGATVIKTAADCLDEMYSTLGRVVDARTSALAVAPGMGAPHQRMGGRIELDPVRGAQLSTAMDAAFDKIAMKVESAKRIVVEQMGQLDKKVHTALAPPPTAGLLGNEIRGYISSLDQKDRLTFVRAVIQSGDLVSTSALMGAPYYLSGLKVDGWKSMFDQASAKFAPREHAQLQASMKVLDHLTRAQETFVRKFAELRPKVDARRQAANAAFESLRTGV